jgi:hypothetical protein
VGGEVSGCFECVDRDNEEGREEQQNDDEERP